MGQRLLHGQCPKILVAWTRREIENPWAQREADGERQEERERSTTKERVPQDLGRGAVGGWLGQPKTLQGEGQKLKNGTGVKAKTPLITTQECSDNKINPQNMKQLQVKLIAWNNLTTTKSITFRMLKEIAESNEGESPLKSTQTIEKWKRQISNNNGLSKSN